MGESSFYELLEVSNSATPEEIEASYQRLAGVMAPDSLAMYAMLDDGEADRVRAQVEEAYRTLSDPDRRSEYDRAHPERAKSHYPDVMLPESSNNSNMSVAPSRREREAAREERPPEREYPREPRDDREYVRESREERTQERELVREVREERPSDRYRDDTRPSAQAVASAPVVIAEVVEEEAKLLPPSRPPSRAPAPVEVSRRGRLLQPNLAIEVTSDTECSGSLLRRLRESANANLDAVAEITKISKRYLHALEENDFDTLPAAVYVRGFVSEYARALGLDPTLVAKSYMSLYKRYRGEGA